jgi:DNA-binding NarL/FixJ family response regulator
MSELAFYSPHANRLRIFVAAIEPTRLIKLRRKIAEIGHDFAAISDDAQVILSQSHDDWLLLTLNGEEGDIAGLLPFACSNEQLDAALHAVAVGLIVRPAGSEEPGFDAPVEMDIQRLLTPRETEVLRAIGEGLTNKGIALQLHISLHTVKFHVEAIFRKLEVRTRTAAIAKIVQWQQSHLIDL